VAEMRTGWETDPVGSHEYRYFSFDGRPTRLVMDGGRTSFDAPPGGLLLTSIGPSDQPGPVRPAPAEPSPGPAAVPAVIDPAACATPEGRRTRRKVLVLTEVGIVFGLMALFGVGLAIAALQAHHSGSGTKAVAPTVSTAGTTINIANARVPGIRTVTVLSLVVPADAQSVPAPQNGNEYAAAHVAMCAGNAGTSGGPDLLFFELLLANGTAVKPNPASTSTPSLATFTSIGAHSCISGYVTFEITTGATPALLRYEPDARHVYEWRLLRPH
jgi:hypothetical protein